MRVLWLDANANPWTDANGWRVLEDFGLQVRRMASVSEAQKELPKKNFDLLLVGSDMLGAAAFMVQCRRLFGESGRKIVMVSSDWSKEQFRAHSKTEGAAHRYARIPMPPEGFINLLADLFGCTVEELSDFEVTDSEVVEEDPPVQRPVKKSRQPAPSSGDNGDMDVLRKYLALREEQLEIAESERDELGLENERLQKEAHNLQLKLREFEHMHDELEKKIAQMEDEKVEADRKIFEAQEDKERSAKLEGERIKTLEAQIAEADEKYENLRSRVRKDIRKIRENERSLEARLELMRKDSETLMQARDAKVLELQRKIDALEFDLDQVQDSRVQAQIEAERYLAKLSRVSRALQIANAMIEDDRAGEAELEDLEPLVGGAANAEEEAEVASESPIAAETPPVDAENAELAEAQELSPELAALANEGEPTQMINADRLRKAGGESGSSSG